MSRLSYLVSALLCPVTVLATGLPGIALQYNPPNRGAPGSTWNAGSRTGPCGDLTAVQPTQTNWGETLEERPTFGIYVSEPATDVTFELRDERSQEIIHTATFEQVDGPGISLYTLPNSAPALATNQYYRWRVSLDCAQFSTDNFQSTGSREDGGIIMRQPASEQLRTQLAATADADKPTLLAAHGLWYDMVHALMVQRIESPDRDNQTTAWSNSWQTVITHPMVQLTNLMNAVPIDCCLTANCPQSNANNTAVLNEI